MKKWILGIGGFLLVMGLAILGRDGRALKKVEAQRDNEIASKTKAGMVKAEKLNKKAESHKANAKLAAEKTAAILEARDEKDPDMGGLLSEWTSKRVQ